MTLFDKSLYVQRVMFAIENKRMGHAIEDLEEDVLWHIRQQLFEAEQHLDETIECLHRVLQHRGVFPRFEEI